MTSYQVVSNYGKFDYIIVDHITSSILMASPKHVRRAPAPARCRWASSQRAAADTPPHIYIYIYIYMEREREGEREIDR